MTGADYDPLTLPAAYFDGLPTGVRHNLPSQPEPVGAKPGHSIIRCSCGRVIAQCRCLGPKVEEIRPHPACGQHDRLQHTPAGGTRQ